MKEKSLEIVAHIAEEIRQRQEALDDHVRCLRATRVSWWEIAEALGEREPAVRTRYKRRGIS